jgi:hypothetical protein
MILPVSTRSGSCSFSRSGLIARNRSWISKGLEQFVPWRTPTREVRRRRVAQIRASLSTGLNRERSSPFLSSFTRTSAGTNLPFSTVWSTASISSISRAAPHPALEVLVVEEVGLEPACFPLGNSCFSSRKPLGTHLPHSEYLASGLSSKPWRKRKDTLHAQRQYLPFGVFSSPVRKARSLPIRWGCTYF